jgi:hypothetical protein
MTYNRNLYGVLPWYRMYRWQYHLDKAAHCGAGAFILALLGAPLWWALGAMLVAYWLVPHAVYLIRQQYAPDPPDWLADLVCCAFLAPFIGWHLYGYAVGVPSLLTWTLLYFVTYPYADEVTVTE